MGVLRQTGIIYVYYAAISLFYLFFVILLMPIRAPIKEPLIRWFIFSISSASAILALLAGIFTIRLRHEGGEIYFLLGGILWIFLVVLQLPYDFLMIIAFFVDAGIFLSVWLSLMFKLDLFISVVSITRWILVGLGLYELFGENKNLNLMIICFIPAGSNAISVIIFYVAIFLLTFTDFVVYMLSLLFHIMYGVLLVGIFIIGWKLVGLEQLRESAKRH